jgi:hypothetical protein
MPGALPSLDPEREAFSACCAVASAVAARANAVLDCKGSQLLATYPGKHPSKGSELPAALPVHKEEQGRGAMW